MVMVKCAGIKNVPNALTKSLPGPAFSLHHPYLLGTTAEYQAFFSSFGFKTAVMT